MYNGDCNRAKTMKGAIQMKMRFIAAMVTAAAILLTGCASGSGGSQQEQGDEIMQENIVAASNDIVRETISLNGNWKYYRGVAESCFSREYDDSDWTWVNLPHNTTLYTAEDKNGYLGVSCYRKQFSLDETYAGKRILLNFEGVMQNCSVYLNGELIAENHNGYIPFCVDISDKVKTDGENLLAVITDSTPNPEYTPGKQNPDFQYFGGIYRNVTLDITDNIYIGNAVEDDVIAGGRNISYISVSKQRQCGYKSKNLRP